MTAESVHTQMILEGLDEVLGLPRFVSGHKVIGSRDRPGWDHKATIDPALIDFHFDNDATGSIPALGSIKKLVKLTLFFLQLNEPQPSRIQQGLNHSLQARVST